MDSSALFDLRASAFYICTGVLPPGKDDPSPSLSIEERHGLYSAWMNQNQKVVDATIKACIDQFGCGDD